MVVGKSPDWLPPGFIEKVKNTNGRKTKIYINVATGVKYYSKPEVMRATKDYGVIVTPQNENGDENGLSIDNKVENYGVLVTHQKENGDEKGLSIGNKVENYGVIVTPQKENGDDNGLSIDNKVDAISINGSPAWLPNGWEVEEKTRHSGSSKGLVYKVYIELSSGKKFYSKAAVARYLNTSDHANTMTVQNNNVNTTNVLELNTNEPNVDEPSTVTSLQLVPMTNTGYISNVDNKPNVDEPSTDMSLQLVSMTETGDINKRKRKSSSFTTVATERSTDDDLPPGWIKEIKISKSGNKMRRDPFYTDPVSGYIFRSKKDALRYLVTKDIHHCACRPLKMEVDDNKLIENEIPSSDPVNEKLPEHNRLGGELNGGEAPSGTVESETNISKQKQVHFESDNVQIEDELLSENSEKNAEIINTSGPEKGNRSRRNSTKSKKRKGLSLPSRTSKRLSGSQPEITPIGNLSEHSLRAAARSSAKIPNSTLEEASAIVSLPPSDIEQSKAVPEEETFKGEGSHQDRLREIVENLFNDVEEPLTEGPPEVQSGGEKQIDETETTQEPQLIYDFGDSWSDPLEFAFKTLMSDISIDDPLTFPSCFSEQNIAPQNQVRGPQNEFAARAESSKQVRPGSPSPSPLGDLGFAGPFGALNRQSSNEVGKKDFQNKYNP